MMLKDAPGDARFTQRPCDLQMAERRATIEDGIAADDLPGRMVKLPIAELQKIENNVKRLQKHAAIDGDELLRERRK